MDKNIDTITITLGDSFTYDYAFDTDNSISDYVNCSSDTITFGPIDHSEIISAGDIIDNIDWFEDQRILIEYQEEKELRERNEGIQAAWEQYKILVELAKNPPNTKK